MGEVRGGTRDACDLDRARNVLVRSLDSAGVRRDDRKGVAHDEDPDQILAELRRRERFLIVPRGRVVVAESPVRVPESLVDECDTREITDVVRPLESLLVVGGRDLRLAHVLRAAAQSDKDAESQELIRRLRGFNPPKERLEHLARPAWIPRDPRRDGELIVGSARKWLVAELARETLRDDERFDRVATAMEKVQSRSRMKPEPAGIAHRQISRIEQLFGTPYGLRRRRAREESLDRADIELALASGTLDIRIVEEVRRRLVELFGHVLQRSHRRADLAELDRADVRAREVRCSELRLRQARCDTHFAQSLAKLLQRRGKRRRTAPSGARGRHEAGR